jgi:glucarate dehydratase
MASTGRIVSVEAWPVNVPLDAPYEFATGVYAGMSRTVVRVVTDEGLIGLGESPSVSDALTLWEQAPDLTGRDASPLLRELAAAPHTGAAPRDSPEMIVRTPQVAVEMALWDIEAQAEGVPLHALLGDQARDEIAVTEYFAFRLPGPSAPGEQTAAEVAAYCARMARDHDSPVFEGKMGVRTPAEELAMLREVRAAIGPDRRLRIDANMAWRPDTARRTLPQLEELGVESVEEPVAGLAAMAELRRFTSIPISAHSTDIEAAAQWSAPDTLVLGIAGCGGIGATLQFAAACAVAGVEFRFYSGDLGIATAAGLHVAAAVGSIRGPHQTLLRWYADDVTVGGPLRPHRGTVPVPTGPGLGVKLDQAALHRGIERFDRDGEYDYYGGPSVPRF